MGDKMFVGITFDDISDDETIDTVLATSEALRKLVQRHNRIAFEQDHINVITKEYTGRQLKEELEKHEPGLLIGLLSDYLNVTKITLSDDYKESGALEVEVEKKKESHTCTPPDPVVVVKNDKEPDDEDPSSLKDHEKRSLKIYFIRALINVLAACTIMLVGIVAYVAWSMKQMPSDTIIGGLFQTATELAKFIFQ